MRNAYTDQLASQLNKAFVKSGMSSEDFVIYLDDTRDLATFTLQGDTCEFFIVNDEGIFQFYFANQVWFCKA